MISHFSESGISFIQEKGTSDIVVVGYKTEVILRNFSSRAKVTSSQEKDTIIKEAADLIRKDIRGIVCEKEVYPETDDILAHEHSIPDSLRLLLQHILRRDNIEVKTSSLGQAIMQCTRPVVVTNPHRPCCANAQDIWVPLPD